MTNLDFEGEGSTGVHTIYSYPAKFIPQIPSFFIEKYKPRVVMDCFGGSGTTAVEAKRHGCQPIHVDIMPISFALARVKCHEFSPRELHLTLVNLRIMLKVPKIDDAEEWMLPELVCHGKEGDYEYFKDEAIGEIMAVRDAIFKLDDSPAKDFMRVCAGQCLGRVASAIIQASHWEPDTHVIHTDFIKVFMDYASRMRNVFLKYYTQNPKFLNGKVPTIINSSKHLSEALPPVDLIVTSPPYGKLVRVVNYPEMHKFTHLFFFDEPSPPPSAFIQSTAELDLYLDKWCGRVIPGGHCVVVVAPSNSDDWVTETRTILSRAGFTCVEDTERVIDPKQKYRPRQIKKEWVLDWVKKS